MSCAAQLSTSRKLPANLYRYQLPGNHRPNYFYIYIYRHISSALLIWHQHIFAKPKTERGNNIRRVCLRARSVASVELNTNTMTTRAYGGLNSSEERERQQMMPPPAHGRNQMHGPDRRNLQLRFQSMFPDSFFTKRNVEGQGGAPIHVKLIDTSTGHVVRSGPESCVKLKVVVVEGDFNNEDDDDWTQEDFESRSVKERDGKSPLLNGKLHVHLKEGVGSLGKLRFTDNSSWTRSKTFRLGVKVASGLREGIRVIEAITNPFVVKDCRGEVYKKHDLPALDDEVWRLKKIRKNGPFHRRLNDNGIFRVEDFLWLLGTDPKGLRKILGSSMREKMWDALVEHAKTCDLRGKHYVYYADNTKNFGVVFESICELSGYIAGGKYYSAETLSYNQEVLVDTLKRKAYDNWKHIVEYDVRMLDMMNQNAAPSEQVLVNPGPSVGGDFFNHTVAGDWHGFLGSKDVRIECGSSSSVLSENYESGSRTSFSSIGDMVSVHSDSEFPKYNEEVWKDLVNPVFQNPGWDWDVDADLEVCKDLVNLVFQDPGRNSDVDPDLDSDSNSIKKLF